MKELNKELRELSVEDKTQSKQKTKRISFIKSKQELMRRDTPFDVGDTVVITNDYKYKKGTQGRLTRSIGDFTFLEDRYEAVHQRAHHNLKKLTNDHERGY